MCYPILFQKTFIKLFHKIPYTWIVGEFSCGMDNILHSSENSNGNIQTTDEIALT